jgi:hypothetical protein
MIIEIPEPHINQQKILDCPSRFIVLMCGRRFGKSELSQIKILQEGLQGKRVAFITPTYLLAQEFFMRLTSILPFHNNKHKLKVEMPNGGSVEFYTGERLDNLRGRKFHHIIMDEVELFKNFEQGWTQSVYPTLTDYHGSAWFLSTPRGKSYFYSLFMRGGEKDWSAFRFTTYDNPYIDKNEIDTAKSQIPEKVFEQEYMANPSDNVGNPFGYDNIKKCIKQLSNKSVKVYGIDLAKSYDWTCITGLDEDGNVCYFDRFQKDWYSTKQEILKLPKAEIIIDSTGVGDPIYEELKRTGMNIQGFKFTSPSKQQLMEGLQSAIHQSKIGYPEGVITNELQVFEFMIKSHGVKYSAPSGFHDDAVMSLALAWHGLSFKIGSGKYKFI